MIKSELRKKYKKLRKELSLQSAEQLSVEIYDRLCENFKLEGKVISVFLPIERFTEINTWPILNLKANFVLPRIKDEVLEHVFYKERSQIQISEWGIPEPVFGDLVNVKDIDMVMIPLLAYDVKGNRVGYGKGFYDSFLSQCKKDCIFIGLSYFKAESKIDDVYGGDIPLDHCVNPFEVINFNH